MLVPKSLKAMTAACDMDNSRYALGAVLVGRGGPTGAEPYAVACDGRILISATWQEPAADSAKCGREFSAADYSAWAPALVDGAAFKAAAAAKGASSGQQERWKSLSHFELVEPIGPRFDVVTRNGAAASVTGAAQIEGRFPRWREVIGQYNAAGSVQIDTAVKHATWQALAEAYRDCAKIVDGAADRALFTDRADNCQRLAEENNPGQALPDAIRVTLDPRYIIRCAEALKAATSSDSVGVDVIVPLCGGKPVLMQAAAGAGGLRMTAVIMPLARDGAAEVTLSAAGMVAPVEFDSEARKAAVKAAPRIMREARQALARFEAAEAAKWRAEAAYYADRSGDRAAFDKAIGKLNAAVEALAEAQRLAKAYAPFMPPAAELDDSAIVDRMVDIATSGELGQLVDEQLAAEDVQAEAAAQHAAEAAAAELAEAVRGAEAAAVVS